MRCTEMNPIQMKIFNNKYARTIPGSHGKKETVPMVLSRILAVIKGEKSDKNTKV